MRFRFLADLAERCARTFAQAYLAFWIALEGAAWDNLLSEDALNVALVATVGVILTALVGSQVGAKDSASLLPANVDPPQ